MKRQSKSRFYHLLSPTLLLSNSHGLENYQHYWKWWFLWCHVFTKNNLCVGERRNAPMTSQQKGRRCLFWRWYRDSRHIIVNSYGYSGSQDSLSFTIHKSPMFMQNRGILKTCIIFTNNKDINAIFVNDKWWFERFERKKIFTS